MQAVITQPDAPADGAIVHHGGSYNGCFGDEEESRNRANMEGGEDDDVHPIGLGVSEVDFGNGGFAHLVSCSSPVARLSGN